jgi:hypothetical protein
MPSLERRIHPAAKLDKLTLPDESGVPFSPALKNRAGWLNIKLK